MVVLLHKTSWICAHVRNDPIFPSLVSSHCILSITHLGDVFKDYFPRMGFYPCLHQIEARFPRRPLLKTIARKHIQLPSLRLEAHEAVDLRISYEFWGLPYDVPTLYLVKLFLRSSRYNVAKVLILLIISTEPGVKMVNLIPLAAFSFMTSEEFD